MQHLHLLPPRNWNKRVKVACYIQLPTVNTNEDAYDIFFCWQIYWDILHATASYLLLLKTKLICTYITNIYKHIESGFRQYVGYVSETTSVCNCVEPSFYHKTKRVFNCWLTEHKQHPPPTLPSLWCRGQSRDTGSKFTYFSSLVIWGHLANLAFSN